VKRLIPTIILVLMFGVGLAIGGLTNETPIDMETRHTLQASYYGYEEGCPLD